MLLQRLYELHAQQVLGGIQTSEAYHFQCGVIQGLRMAAESPDQIITQLATKDKKHDGADDRQRFYLNSPYWDGFQRAQYEERAVPVPAGPSPGMGAWENGGRGTEPDTPA